MPTIDPDPDDLELDLPEDWTCPNCSTSVWAYLLECPKCHEPKP